MNKNLIKKLVQDINGMAVKELKIMEVCGTHTQIISKLGIRNILSSKIELLSGPGCPVCVTNEEYIDRAIAMLNQYDITIATFGDLLRVKGSGSSLAEEKAKGKDVKVIHSPMDLIQIAERDENRKIVFLSVGFETTAPIIALAIKISWEKMIKNLFFLTSLKLMNPILHYILKQPQCRIQGLICPGHVAVIKGANYFKFISEDYNIPATVCGFEALDIIGGIHFLVRQITQNENTFNNLYKRSVRADGNLTAKKLMDEVFEISRGEWRGIGVVESSSLTIKKKYEAMDAMKNFPVVIKSSTKNRCECGEVLLGHKRPIQCKLFGFCNPINPQGPCMVSTEGACAIAYKYGGEM